MTSLHQTDTAALEQERRDLSKKLSAVDFELARRYRNASEELQRERAAWQTAQVLKDRADSFNSGPLT